jgi:hypothetical protein
VETRAVTNEEQARYWNGDEAAHWLAHEERYDRMLAPFTGHLLTAAAIGRADRVVDSRLVFVCWQNLADNEWIVIPGAAAAAHVALPPLDDPAAPGPFSLGDPDRIATVLRAAGLSEVAIDPIAEPLWMGYDVAGAVAFLKTTGIGNSLLRNANPATVARVTEAVQAALEPYLTPDGLLLGSRAWLVTASRP